MPWLFLIVTSIGAWFTFNAYIPQRRTGPLVIPSFFAGWLTSELSAHHFAWQLAATLFFIWAGALRAWPGWVGLGITLASWLGLLALGRIAQRAAPVVEAALQDALGPGYAERILPEVVERLETPDPPGRQLVPFLLFDRQVLKNSSPLQNLDDPHFHDLFGRKAIDALVGVFNAAAGDLSILAAQQPRDGTQNGRFSCSVCAKQGNDLAIRDVQRHAPQDLDNVAIDDFDVVQSQHIITLGSR